MLAKLPSVVLSLSLNVCVAVQNCIKDKSIPAQLFHRYVFSAQVRTLFHTPQWFNLPLVNSLLSVQHIKENQVHDVPNEYDRDIAAVLFQSIYIDAVLQEYVISIKCQVSADKLTNELDIQYWEIPICHQDKKAQNIWFKAEFQYWKILPVVQLL